MCKDQLVFAADLRRQLILDHEEFFLQRRDRLFPGTHDGNRVVPVLLQPRKLNRSSLQLVSVPVAQSILLHADVVSFTTTDLTMYLESRSMGSAEDVVENP